MMKRLYITYCSGTKDDLLKGTGKRVPPDKIYISQRIRSFVSKCREKGVEWAIFSDKYSVLFPQDEIEWYEMPPDDVTEEHFTWLLDEFLKRTARFDEIWFYYEEPTFHPVYRRLIEESIAQGRSIKAFNSLDAIR